MDYAKTILDGLSCEVYFFKSWSTYSHPVTPQEPVSYKDAIKSKGFCLAWMCKSGESELFSMFQARENRMSRSNLFNPNKTGEMEFYELVDKGRKSEFGRKLSIDETIDLQQFLFSSPGSDDELLLSKQSISYTYRYFYKDDKTLRKVVVTNMLGEEHVLEY
ncbi:MAG: hypothetical protein GY820_46045 [Gammaproteobacteria bacterium]|nr:hypothetical protein [Gammaproteobacteria bacterium]